MQDVLQPLRPAPPIPGREEVPVRVRERPRVIAPSAVLVDSAAPRLEAFESVVDSGLTFRFSRRALERIREGVLQDYSRGKRHGLENGGVLFGRKEGRFIYVFEALPIECEHPFGPEFRLSTGDEVRLEKLLRTPVRDWRGGLLQPIGWYCSHSAKQAWVQERDLYFHAQNFGQPFQLILIGTRRSRSGVDAVVFLADAEGRVDVAQPGPRLQLQPTLLNSEPRSFLQFSWILTAVAVVLLGIVLWKIGLAAGLGNATNRVPLQAQVVDSGLLITWDGRDARHKLQSAKLRVRDGKSDMQIPLSENLLHKGMLLYLRRSSPVIIALKVERESLPAEEQTVIFLDPKDPGAISPNQKPKTTVRKLQAALPPKSTPPSR